MIFYIDETNQIIIKGTTTKASKHLRTAFSDLGLVKILECNHSGFGTFGLDLSIFGYTEQITATAYYKEYGIEIPEIQ